MRADDLLTEIEPLAYPARSRRLADLRRHAGDPSLHAMLDDLGGRGHYERSLALFVAAAVRDEESLARVAAMMRDPATDLALSAIEWAARLGVPYGPFEELLGDAPHAVRAAVYHGVRRFRRADLAERLIDVVAARWGEEEAATLLPACGERVVRERLDGMAHAVGNWHSLGWAHPGPVLDHAERVLPATPEGMRRFWWSWHGCGIAAAVRHAPDRVITLLERFSPADDLPFDLLPRMRELLTADPARTLPLLLAAERRHLLPGLLGRRAVREWVARRGGPDLVAVLRAVRDHVQVFTMLLRDCPPSRRDELFAAAMDGVDLAAAELDPRILDVLPHAARAREARRMLGLRQVAEHPARTWEVTSFLPFDEALPVLRKVARGSDADERARGYAALIRCAARARDPEVITRLLDTCLDRLRNEQDPVRAEAVGALSALPARLLRAAHVPAFTRIAEDALRARDCSYQTRRQLTELATSILRQGARDGDAELLALAFEVLRRLAGQTGTLHLPRLDEGLPAGREYALGRAMAAYLSRASARDDHRLALALAWALRRRATGVPEIEDALERALDAREDSVIRQAIDLWLAPPRTRAERVGRVVAREPSAVVFPRVFATIARERTDLLSLVLSDRPPSGRFRHPSVRYVPIAPRGWARRWTARQRTAYLESLHRVAGDVSAPTSDRGRAVAALADVPDAVPDDLRRYYDPELRRFFDDTDAYLARIALSSAVWLPSPEEVLPDLLDHASSDDAHVAMYAASRAARFVPPSALREALAPVIADGKITSRKEALRILLRERAPDAMDVVAAAWDDPEQHRDVRVAIASAARQHLSDPQARRILGEAARGPRELAQQVVGAPPYMIEERHRARYAALMLEVARSPAPQAVLAAIPALPPWASYDPGVAELLAGHVTALEDTATWRPALSALLSCALAGHGLAELATAAAGLAAAPDSPDAGAERDRPAGQRLAELVAQVRLLYGRDRGRAGPLVRALAGRLPEPLDAELIAAALPWDAPGVAADLDALAARPLGGVLATGRVARALAFGRYTHDLDGEAGFPFRGGAVPEPEEAHPHAARLAGRDDLASGLFACALTAHHGERTGWREEWRETLRRLRAHPHPDVAHAARALHTAAE
ncbi:hypothetical protein GCM10023085_00760 [Actinomadura viridis]|uniref:Uncharacterized protein n=1 Tax=Actinomadura viridis TaxID=58110 RepID=A0A931DNM0_9ACTN|nr:hypothetical protein [Actinomadura viridis]MBG6090896.1 hypothetical protein [Actinomadura viridis]